jgi:uncharacterized Zn-binding protein involved in type VI secretion
MSTGFHGWNVVPRLALAAVLFLGAGCGSAGQSADATVTGKVLINGKPPATEGTVLFMPAAGGAVVREAPIGKDGTYTVTTATGANNVTLGGKLVARHARLCYQMRSCQVRSGSNTFDLDIRLAGR